MSCINGTIDKNLHNIIIISKLTKIEEKVDRLNFKVINLENGIIDSLNAIDSGDLDIINEEELVDEIENDEDE